MSQVNVGEKSAILLHGVTIDESNTVIREDCFSFEQHEDGYIFRVMVAIPPFFKIKVDELINLLHCLLIEHKILFPQMFNRTEKIAHSFQKGEIRDAVIAEYALSNSGSIQSETLYLGKVIVSECLTYSECETRTEIAKYAELLSETFKGKPHLSIRLKKDKVSRTQKTNNPGIKFVYGSLDLFNYTCRKLARGNSVPFIALPRTNDSEFIISKWFARFNCAFRDPCAFINLANLVCFLSNEPFLLTKEELQEYLPRRLEALTNSR